MKVPSEQGDHNDLEKPLPNERSHRICLAEFRSLVTRRAAVLFAAVSFLASNRGLGLVSRHHATLLLTTLSHAGVDRVYE